MPEIENLVFIRRVRSRILYEPMLGRATRLCPDIGKESFRIFDAVDLYAALAPYTEMKPVSAKPKFSFSDLVQEIIQVEDSEFWHATVDELRVKFHRKKRHLEGEALESFRTLTGLDPEGFVSMLKSGDRETVRGFFTDRSRVPDFLDRLGKGTGAPVLVSDHEDNLVSTERGYGTAKRPEDYLEEFATFIKENMNAIPALLAVIQRPRELTRKELKALKLALDEKGYTEANLKTAWAEVTNREIAASIIGFIRR